MNSDWSIFALLNTDDGPCGADIGTNKMLECGCCGLDMSNPFRTSPEEHCKCGFDGLNTVRWLYWLTAARRFDRPSFDN